MFESVQMRLQQMCWALSVKRLFLISAKLIPKHHQRATTVINISKHSPPRNIKTHPPHLSIEATVLLQGDMVSPPKELKNLLIRHWAQTSGNIKDEAHVNLQDNDRSDFASAAGMKMKKLNKMAVPYMDQSKQLKVMAHSIDLLPIHCSWLNVMEGIYLH